jgi:hypothetical protein
MNKKERIIAIRERMWRDIDKILQRTEEELMELQDDV